MSSCVVRADSTLLTSPRLSGSYTQLCRYSALCIFSPVTGSSLVQLVSQNSEKCGLRGPPAAFRLLRLFLAVEDHIWGRNSCVTIIQKLFVLKFQFQFRTKICDLYTASLLKFWCQTNIGQTQRILF